MSAYRLEPIPNRLTDPAWEFSTINEAVWAGAIYPIEARELVAGMTISAPTPQGTLSPMLRSPWLDAELTTCVWVSQKEDVALGAVQRIGDYRAL